MVESYRIRVYLYLKLADELQGSGVLEGKLGSHVGCVGEARRGLSKRRGFVPRRASKLPAYALQRQENSATFPEAAATGVSQAPVGVSQASYRRSPTGLAPCHNAVNQSRSHPDLLDADHSLYRSPTHLPLPAPLDYNL